MEPIEFTREELFDLVWKEPLSRLALKYNISDNGIRKRCKKMKIPLPPTGYWMRIKHGYKVPRPKLSKKYDGETKTTLCFRTEKGEYIEKVDSPKKLLRNEILSKTELPIKVPDSIEKYDTLVARARKTLLKKKAYSYDYVGLYGSGKGQLDIMVSDKNMNRSLRFADTLVKLLKARKHKVYVEHNTSYVEIFGEKFDFRIRERGKIVYTVEGKYDWKKREYHPSGILTFQFNLPSYKRKEWQDTAATVIEDKLADILVYMELLAKQEIADRIESEKRRIIREEEERKRKELQKRKDDEFARMKQLVKNANFWKQAQVVREYISAIENDETIDSINIEWLPWAKQKVEWLDPFVKEKDELLNDDDRDRLIDEILEQKAKRNHLYYGY